MLEPTALDTSTADSSSRLTPFRASQPLVPLAAPSAVSTRLAGAAFLVSGFALSSAIIIELALSRGAVLPSFLFRLMHWQAPLTLALAAGAGWTLYESRLARWLSGITVGFVAFRMAAERYSLPRLDGTLPRILLALGLITGGLYLALRRSSKTRSLTSA